MKKLLLYMSIVVTGAAMLRADVTSSVTESIISGDAADVCPSIGNWGRLLSALPAKTKDAVLYKCENVFLGLGKSKSDDYVGNRAVHPRAWWAVLNRKPSGRAASEELTAEKFANLRREYLKANRKTMLPGTNLSAKNQAMLDEVLKMIANMPMPVS